MTQDGKTTTNEPRRLSSLATWRLSRAAGRSHRILHEHLRAAGVSGYEYRVLAALADLGPQSQADIGRAAGLDRRDVTHTVRDLAARRLVGRRPDKGDGRRMLVSLTRSGESILDHLDSVVEGVQDEVFGPLTSAQRRTLTELLGRLS